MQFDSCFEDFDSCFEALTGHKPMSWQKRFFDNFCNNNLPAICNIPTGLGKTSIIPIWLIALATSHNRICRRLVYIVNRRTVVDQATEVVEKMRQKLRTPEGKPLTQLKDKLKNFCSFSDEEVFGLSTLRGELADNQEWKADPARPAVVIGTIDMIGSKLLFSGYGDGRYLRAHHAGLIGQDTLIVHDEAHLTPAFSDLLQAIVKMQAQPAQKNDFLRSVQVIELSATTRDQNNPTPNKVFSLNENDDNDKIVQQRLSAPKQLFLHDINQGQDLTEEIINKCIVYDDKQKRVLIYVHKPNTAQEIAEQLNKKLKEKAKSREKKLGTDTTQEKLQAEQKRVILLTGTIRGYERDLLLNNPVMGHFLNGQTPQQTVYLISTSAGEVGIDLDADCMVCDLTTLDSLIQRLGRVNRRGNGTECRVDVICDSEDKNQATSNTLEILKQWQNNNQNGIDVSLKNLTKLLGQLEPQKRQEAFSPKPTIKPLTNIHLDRWSLTSLSEMEGRAEIDQFLHGHSKEVPETFIVWRQEIKLFANNKVNLENLENWFHACRIESHERLCEPTDNLKKKLKKLLDNHKKKNEKENKKENQINDFDVVVLDNAGNLKFGRDNAGNLRLTKLSEILEENYSLEFKTVVLPVEAGGLNDDGILDPKVFPQISNELDVCEKTKSSDRRRYLCTISGNDTKYWLLDNTEILSSEVELYREKMRIVLDEQDDDEDTAPTRELVLCVSPQRSALEDPETASAQQTLDQHHEIIEKKIKAIASKLSLPENIQGALVTAAKWHDQGKARKVWQRFANNDDDTKIFAKAVKYRSPQLLEGYRHELGSILDAMKDDAICNHPERDLILHLIAAHHGWARPHFEEKAFDHDRSIEDNQKAVLEVIRRFECLQQRFGHWGLAWLESLLRCADIAASKPSQN